MGDTIKHRRRRWFQFRLRTQFVLMTLFALWLGWELNFIRERHAVHKWVVDNGGIVVLGTDQREIAAGIVEIPLWRQWLGDYAVGMAILKSDAKPADVARAKAAFPEVLYCEVARPAGGGTQQPYQY